MSRFIHHPDGYINIDGEHFPIAFWEMVEPDYVLPEGYIGRTYAPENKHYLMRDGGGVDIEPLGWTQGDLYISQKADYVAARDAWQAGAFVGRDVEGDLIVQGPPVLTADDGAVIADGVAVEVITCDVGDPSFTGEIVWTAISPDGIEVQAPPENMVGGSRTLNLTIATNDIGNHVIRADVETYGSAAIAIEAI